MTKRILTAVLVLSAGLLFAQSPIQKGMVNLAGSASYTSTSIEDVDDSYNTLSVSPQAYYLISNNLAVGGVVTYTRYSHGDNASTTFLLGPGAKYYFNSSSNTCPFVFANYQMATDTEKDSDDKTKSSGFTVGAGVDLFLNPHVAIMPFVSYTMGKNKYESDWGDSESSVNTLMIGVGVSAYTGK